MDEDAEQGVLIGMDDVIRFCGNQPTVPDA
jgi:hypothetical protein